MNRLLLPSFQLGTSTYRGSTLGRTKGWKSPEIKGGLTKAMNLKLKRRRSGQRPSPLFSERGKSTSDDNRRNRPGARQLLTNSASVFMLNGRHFRSRSNGAGSPIDRIDLVVMKSNAADVATLLFAFIYEYRHCTFVVSPQASVTLAIDISPLFASVIIPNNHSTPVRSWKRIFSFKLGARQRHSAA